MPTLPDVAAPRECRAGCRGGAEVVQGVAAATLIRHVPPPGDAIGNERGLRRHAVATIATHPLRVATEDVLHGHFETRRRAVLIHGVFVRIDHAEVVHHGGSGAEGPARATSALVQDHPSATLREAAWELVAEVDGGGDGLELRDMLEITEVEETRQVVVHVAVAPILRELAEAVLLKKHLRVRKHGVDGGRGSAHLHKHLDPGDHAFFLLFELNAMSAHVLRLVRVVRHIEQTIDFVEGLARDMAHGIRVLDGRLKFNAQAVDDFE
mmetsp:Transcript_89756/g.257153  ORF Transcript_89756/g.257153 Transcript_89756/m.257153 type:complete len:267 (+) Transcript_89756:846-1646(+)